MNPVASVLLYPNSFNVLILANATKNKYYLVHFDFCFKKEIPSKWFGWACDRSQTAD